MPTKKPRTVKKTPRRSRIPEAARFLVKVEDWSISYSLGTGRDSLFTRNGLEEHQHLHISARMLGPKRFADRLVEMTLLGTRDYDILLERANQGSDGLLVGTLTLRGQRNDFLGSLPASAIWGIVTALAAERINYIYMTGGPPRYGSATIRWMSFDRDFDPDDIPE